MKESTQTGLGFKKSMIRIWIHQRNLENLQHVVWEGCGPQLLVEHSNNPKVKKFLEAVPHTMGLIKEIHCDVQNDDLESLKSRVSSPMPLAVLAAKDHNGLTPLHKAAGLGRQDVARYIIKTLPSSVNAVDNEGRTPLHYAALLKDDNKMFNLLLESGANEAALDNRQKAAAYYRTRTNEIDSKLLNVVPECPRGAKPEFASHVDWNALGSAMSSANGVAKDVNDNVTNGESEATEKKKRETREEEAAGGVGTGRRSQLRKQDSVVSKSKTIRDEEDPEEPEEPAGPEEPAEPDESDIITTQPDEEEPGPSQEEPENQADEDIIENGNVEEPPESPQPPNDPEEIEPEPTDEPKEEAKGEEEVEGDDREEVEEPDEPGPAKDQVEPEPEEELEGPTTRPSSGIVISEDHNEQAESDTRKLTGSLTRSNSRADGEDKEEENVGTGEERPEDDPDVEGEKIIEGIVNGENEVEPMNKEGRSRSDDDLIKTMIESGNMEQLAALVLNGEGESLVGQRSDNPELQAFLDNVPIYMSKIHAIHVASHRGNLRELQAALDRRKFAVARDHVSPCGATPLHVAIAFGRTSVVRYLAGRFPETLLMEDDNARTPLHYAAVLRDNGHYYNLLLHLGSDSKAKDKFGHTPEYYLKNQSEFSHKKLLTDFGAEEDEIEEMLKDQDNALEESEQVNMPFFATEEGRYLASSLGDPLIKGLTEVANKRPQDPIAYLATYLYNFARGQKENGPNQEQFHQEIVRGSPQMVNDNKAVPASIDVVTVEPDDDEGTESAFNAMSRDEHGQSMLHFAAARTHGRNALFQLLLETEMSVAYRDELYRTARDISIQANIPENTAEIDRYVLHVATKGDTGKLVELLLEGYDHITDIVDDEDASIIEAVAKQNQSETVSFLQSVLAFEEKRERVHHAVRQGSLTEVMHLLADENDTGSGKLLAIGKNNYGRSCLHVAVLCQQEEIVDYLANTFPDTLKIGDNLERTALHYAMGVEKMETISKVLIKAGAKRVVKDLKGRQPTYYFLNKSEIVKLQEEEEMF